MSKDISLSQLLVELSSKAGAPGGGSVAGLAGAFASAMISMVCNLTIGKKKYQEFEDEMKQNLEYAEKLREEFLLLAGKDAEVFNEVMEAYRLPHESDDEKNERKIAVEEATKRASLVPMDILRRCEYIAKLSRSVALKGNENSISEAGVAATMTLAAGQSASLNILINLSTISDEDFISKLKSEQENVLKTIKDISDETMNIVFGKL
jgi:formiminotetrahydrofolate cyclodeaminase